jgi:MoaA/NifB/PqqE/SkfB family radical SAM enzyme
MLDTGLWEQIFYGAQKIIKENIGLDKYLNREIRFLFKDALKILFKESALAKFFLQTYKWQKKAASLRLDWEKRGVHVPPFMIFSITERCNLSCKGCYAQAFNRKGTDEISPEKLRDIIEQAHQLGTSIILIAGGEPLVRKEIINITGSYPDIIFPVFTNGLLIDEEMISVLEKQKNFIPIFSIEGNQAETNSRRGEGVYEYVKKIINKIRGKSIFWGLSLTLEKDNFGLITGEEFVKELLSLGCKIFFYISYVPVKYGTEDMCLTGEQEKKISTIMNDYKARFPALFIAFPGGEEEMGGCLASGRGFVHISAEGNLEPCPFAPYSDTSLKDLTLKDALSSEFLRKIRENHENLKETKGGCALWENRQWVASLLKEDHK